jgi:hypothetical protein
VTQGQQAAAQNRCCVNLWKLPRLSCVNRRASQKTICVEPSKTSSSRHNPRGLNATNLPKPSSSQRKWLFRPTQLKQQGTIVTDARDFVADARDFVADARDFVADARDFVADAIRDFIADASITTDPYWIWIFGISEFEIPQRNINVDFVQHDVSV